MKKKRKNSNYKADFTAEKTSKRLAVSGKKKLIIFISVFLALVLALGIFFAVSFSIKNRNAVFKYNGISLSPEQTSFFASYYKTKYMKSLSESGETVEDTPEFWNKDNGKASTYGELLEYGTREYIKQVLVGNYLFDSYARLKSADRDKIKEANNSVLMYNAGNSVDTFNELSAKHGFDYSVFLDCSEMMYKAQFAVDAVFGEDGAKLQSEHELSSDYLEEYSCVKLIFIRTEKDFKVNEAGDRIQVDGKDVLYELTEEEKAKRQADIAAIRAAIEGFATGGDVQMSTTMFESYLATYKSGDDKRDANGYYFHKDSKYTNEFSEELKDVVENSLKMEIESYGEASFKDGVCFIYKTEPEDGAYLIKDNSDCFSDFYSNAAVSIMNTMIEELIKDVEVSEKIKEFDFIALPYNYVFYPKF